MKTALITTTINVPKVLALYRKLGPDVRFFVAGDHKTPREAYDFVLGMENTQIAMPESGHQYKCSALVGFDTVRRRNIALLEALKAGADTIVTIDDDNLGIGLDYFDHFERLLDVQFLRPGHLFLTPNNPFNGLKASSPSHWFDAGQLMIPQTPHRGFPYDKKAQPSYEPITDAKIGVAAGLCLGDPDIDAVTRIALAPSVHGVSELARAGVVVDPKENWTVFNTQNTAFIRELAPAMFCAPGLGRFDDIVASLITQRVMRSRGLHVHFGQPFVWQQRNSHNLIKDLEEEVWGMKHLTMFADYLDRTDIWNAMPPNASVCDELRTMWTDILTFGLIPHEAAHAALAFLDDCEGVL